MAEKEKSMSDIIPAAAILLLTLIPLLVISMLIYRFRKDKSPEGKGRFLKKSVIISAIIILLMEIAGLWILNGENPLGEKLNARNFYCRKSIDAFDKAIRINPYRQDLRLNYAKAFRCINRVKDAEIEESMAKQLPEYDLHASLKFNHP